MRRDIRSRCFEGLPFPDIIPGGDGSLQAEWHEVEVELTYRVEPNGGVHTWVHDRVTGAEIEAAGAEALMLFAKWLPNLVSNA